MQELTVVCQTCGKIVEQGHLGVDVGAVAAYRQAVNEWNALNPGGAGTLGSLMEHPEQVAWTAHCEACEPNTCGYCIQADQLRTYKDLARWSAHLMGKTWLDATDWDELLEQVVAGKDKRVREVAA